MVPRIEPSGFDQTGYAGTSFHLESAFDAALLSLMVRRSE